MFNSIFKCRAWQQKCTYDYGMQKDDILSEIAVHDSSMSASKVWNLCFNNRK